MSSFDWKKNIEESTSSSTDGAGHLPLLLWICLHLLLLPLQINLRLLNFPLPQDPVILMSMALAYLLKWYLPLAFAYFLYIKLFMQIKTKSMKNRINNQNDVIGFRSDDDKTLYNKWVVLIEKRKTLNTIKDGLIITAAATGISFAIKAANVKPPNASVDVIYIMKLSCQICGGFLVKDYTVYKKLIKYWYNKHVMAP